MKVNDPNTSSAASAGSSQAQQTGRTGSKPPAQQTPPGGTLSSDDVHLSELVRSLRSLAADSPQRQAHLEQIARTYAQGNYKIDAHATAAKIIDDATHYK